MEPKTFAEALEDLSAVVDDMVSKIVEWWNAFSAWLLETGTAIIQSLAEIFTCVSAQQSIMRRKIQRYLTYKRLALWLAIGKINEKNKD